MKFSHHAGGLVVLTLIHFHMALTGFCADAPAVPVTAPAHYQPSLASLQTQFVIIYVLFAAFFIGCGMMLRGGRGHVPGPHYHGGNGSNFSGPPYSGVGSSRGPLN